MSSENSLPSDTAIGASRKPQQHRSRASLERMLDATETLLIDRGNDDFTLNEVGRVGRVSIGSIYNRFSSKDELIHAVHERMMQHLETQQTKIVVRARSKAHGPVALIQALLDELADFLRDAAAIMRPMMLRAAFDRTVQDRGRIAHDLMAGAIAAEMLTLRAHFQHEDAEPAVHSVIRIAYAAFARELGFGMAEAPQHSFDWDTLKRVVGDMSAAYLFCSPANVQV